MDVEWLYDGPPATEVTVEFFANGHCHPSGFGEGGAFIGAEVVNTDGNGHAEMVSQFPDVPPGQYITATATTDEGTSEFSECVKGQGLGTAGDADCDEDSDVDDALAMALEEMLAKMAGHVWNRGAVGPPASGPYSGRYGFDRRDWRVLGSPP